MGRKRAKLNYDIVDTALFFTASLKQLAYLLEQKGIKLDPKTIGRIIERDKKQNFSSYREYQMSGLRMKLIQKAIKLALEGNVTMLIFCLKNLCNWSDKSKNEIDEFNQMVSTVVVIPDNQRGDVEVQDAKIVDEVIAKQKQIESDL